MRRHLVELEASGLVEHDRMQRGTGAPTYAYRLTDEGEALFPNQYEDALKRLLQHVVDTEGRSVAVSVLEKQYLDLRRNLGEGFETMDAPDRLRAVADMLGEAGFMAEYEERDGEMRLVIHNCAIHAAAACLPEVCDSELTFLQATLEAPLERGAHIMQGCNACEYSIRTGRAPSGAATDTPTAPETRGDEDLR